MKKSIKVSKTAHYYYQIPEKEVKKILFVLHGYAQLASDFIKEFDYLKSSSILVVAPEALSKFYNKHHQPVANWMTSYEREDEIEDYITYLKRVEAEIFEEFGTKEKLALGFSQGVSTLFRWLKHTEVKAAQIYACSGSIPPELTLDDAKAFQKSQITYYYGDNDRLLPVKSALKQIDFLNSLSVQLTAVAFSGRHEISAITKSDIEKQLIKAT